MRRKTTVLEENLYGLGYRLIHKTYYGKKSEKVDEFVYTKYENDDVYYVYLNRERTKIDNFAFTSNRYCFFNKLSIEDIKETYEKLETTLKEIYDFENQKAKFKEMIDLSVDFVEDYPFVEESAFDD